jgi:ribosomal protein S18 acetylase RimI-like enzyme
VADSASNTTGVRLRRASVADVAAIARIHVASWRAAYRAELPGPFLDALSETERAKQWEERLAVPGMVVVLAERDGTLAGFCAHGPARDAENNLTNAWEIYSLHITPELRGIGIGSILFAEGRAAAARAGAHALTLWVVATNVPAQRFYESKAMHADGGARRRQLATGIALDEVHFRVPVE